MSPTYENTSIVVWECYNPFETFLEQFKTLLYEGRDGILDIGDGDLDLNTSLDVDLGDVLDDLLGGVQVDDALVDLHLVAVPGVETVTARGLTGGDAQGAGGQADGAADLDLLLVGAGHQVGGDLLEGLSLGGG